MKVIDVTLLPELLKDIIPEGNTEIIEGIMTKAVESEDMQPHIDAAVKEAVEKANAESKAQYAKQLHDMFFKGEPPAKNEDGSATGEELRGTVEKAQPAPSIFVPIDKG